MGLTDAVAGARQKMLGRKEFIAYIDEGALRRQVGGPRVMANLLQHRPVDVEPYLQSTVDAVALDPARSVRLIESVIEARPQRGDFLGQ
ncbi:Scr1 family TA system antitoxin-like transcriptional regulator [Amycolatopsis azurea]|uniref:Scr1 family TA system antitoxin-like transcriptional regulator n=1 Tax=Amycolatopsis azurea TaxID=36819 RepID=UPI00380FBF98